MISWSSKQRRCYTRIKWGLLRHRHFRRLRFLTLTSVPEQKTTLSVAYTNLVNLIHKLTPSKLIADGYLTENQAIYYYGKNNLDVPFRFDYIKITTSEGYNGVYHILFFGGYLPYSWLFDSWKRLLGVDYLSKHGVDIRQCDKDVHNVVKLSRYCVSQYVVSQNKNGETSYLRYHISNGWICQGFQRIYERVSHAFHKQGCYNAKFPDWRTKGFFCLTKNQMIEELINRSFTKQKLLFELPKTSSRPMYIGGEHYYG
jgi:hypothetical protein